MSCLSPVKLLKKGDIVKNDIPNRSPEDIAKLSGEVQKESNDSDELSETSHTFQVDYVKCISCGREKSEHEMQKVFYKKYKGICKNCFRLEIEE
jgi:hypothetical protein